MRTTPFLILLAGCQLGPLVDDDPQVSVHVLPPGTEIPSVGEDPELVHQITVHDGLDDGDLEEAGGVVPRIVGWADGAAIEYWTFGKATRVGAQAYILMDGDQPVDHPWLLDTIPGDATYSPIRRLQRVQVTGEYQGEVIATVAALADAIDLGLVEEPVATGRWVNAPVVPPGTRLDVGLYDDPAEPIEAYAAGYRVDQFRFGGGRGEQPLRFGGVPAAQVSVLFEGSSARPTAEPVFQLGIPAEPPGEDYNYTPLVTVVEVRLADGVVAADSVHDDADLFVRSGSGSINAFTALVESYEVTETMLNWPMQFVGGEP